MARAGVLYVCCRRELAIAIFRSKKAGTNRPVAESRSTRSECRRGQQSEPEPAFGPEALLRSEVVRVELAGLDSQSTGSRCRVNEDEAFRGGSVVPTRSPHGRLNTGRGLIVGEAVRVHRRFGDRPRIGARRRDEDVGLFEERRRPGALDEFGGEFAERQVLAPRLDEAEGRDVPERRGPAISQYDLVALRQPEEVGQTGAEMFHDPSDRAPDGGSSPGTSVPRS